MTVVEPVLRETFTPVVAKEAVVIAISTLLAKITKFRDVSVLQ